MTIENLQKKVKKLEAQLKSRAGDKERKDGEGTSDTQSLTSA